MVKAKDLKAGDKTKHYGVIGETIDSTEPGTVKYQVSWPDGVKTKVAFNLDEEVELA